MEVFCMNNNQIIQEIKETIGNEAFEKLVDNFGGAHLYIPMRKSLEWEETKLKAIQLLKSGFNPLEISRVCKISVATVYRFAQELKKQE